MGKHRYTTEEILRELPRVDVLIGQGRHQGGVNTPLDDLRTTRCRLNDKCQTQNIKQSRQN